MSTCHWFFFLWPCIVLFLCISIKPQVQGIRYTQDFKLISALSLWKRGSLKLWLTLILDSSKIWSISCDAEPMYGIQTVENSSLMLLFLLSMGGVNASLIFLLSIDGVNVILLAGKSFCSSESLGDLTCYILSSSHIT